MAMATHDALELRQALKDLPNKDTKDLCEQLAVSEADKEAKLQEMARWVRGNVPETVGKVAQTGIAAVGGAVAGAAMGALPEPWGHAVVAAVGVAEAATAIVADGEHPELANAAHAALNGTVGFATGRETEAAVANYVAKKQAQAGAK